MIVVLGKQTTNIFSNLFSICLRLRSLNDKICISFLKYHFEEFTLKIDSEEVIKHLFIYKCSFNKFYLMKQLWDDIRIFFSINEFSFENRCHSSVQIYGNAGLNKFNESFIPNGVFNLEFLNLIHIRYDSNFRSGYNITSQQLNMKRT